MKYLYRISLIFMILTIMSALVLGGYFLYQTNRAKENIGKTPKEDSALETAATGSATDCDTEYIVLEYDLMTGESTPYVEMIPAKYIGKTKEEMELVLSEEEKAPTLRERQKGLESIRLSAFSRDRIVIVKSYDALQAENEKTVSGQDYDEEEDMERSHIEAAELASEEENEETQAQALETMGSGNKRISELLETGAYYLMAREGYVCVYYEDLKTIYLVTDILIDNLPDKVRQEVLDKKYMKNEEELYNFLESYSS